MTPEQVCARLHIGDKVQYSGRGVSVLYHGPGRVVRLYDGMADVEVLVGGDVLSHQIRAGQRFFFPVESLEVVK